jgi:uncharacterized membrane-anchored protein YhcB (DUF1043 family)
MTFIIITFFVGVAAGIIVSHTIERDARDIEADVIRRLEEIKRELDANSAR